MHDFEILLDVIKSYNEEEIERIKKAYSFASEAHKNQVRQSGEPYIIHPINVCINLAKFHADGATLVAGMLHDVVEDTKYTIEDIENEFGSEVAKLVLGVTKINDIHFSSLDEARDANIRRIITSLNDDVRIIIIKLCDRLHNMRTLKFKESFKQQRSALETLSIFVPLAYFIGAFRLKCELEDICLSYLKPEIYEDLLKKQQRIKREYSHCIEITSKKISEMLDSNSIKYEMRSKLINIYNVYKKIKRGYKINEIHDLVNIKVIVETRDECYRVLGLVHKLFKPMNYKFKDYIATPKTNMYRSLHTTVFGPLEKLIQIQIKTKDMDNINTYGLASYWNQYRGMGSKKMQEELLRNYQFMSTITDLNETIKNDKAFIEKIKNEIFSNNIYVYTANGDIVELPNNSTPIDFAYKIHTNIGNHLSKCFVNGDEVSLDYKLKNKDRIIVIVKDSSHPYKKWLNIVTTSLAKRKIKEYFKSKE
ncbi:MAG: bifunctional (p)ppGpp synthetase/guanosine-3',5'-bis(diphosphate) 3'-pyrophosphohydrolase [Bacilli bacterium]|nr:bifunctional (p)ppGpp synthetase/guanosine-3',5'-bis(diphosphate) 3'-pyrophosphohydrolase [Bacilli bacterium]